MHRVALPDLDFVKAWRDAARRLASNRIAPDSILWDRGLQDDLFGAFSLPEHEASASVTVPRQFHKLADAVLCHSDPGAPALLYQALYRHQTNRSALGNPSDPLTQRTGKLAKAVRRDIHKMHAFVRFRELPNERSRRRFGAWFEPDHLILEAAAPFFARRFGDMDWMIATPQGVARFESAKLSFHPPVERPDLPEDASEGLWGTYFTNIFNPARIHLKAMRSEMPVKYWKNLPETRLIPEMLADAESRVSAMRAAMPKVAPARAGRIISRLKTDDVAGDPHTLDEAKLSAATCRRCGLCEAATQTVWGEGDPEAGLMIVGEQPGDTEDLKGRVFIGPAGQLLRTLMTEAGLKHCWLTNAVKHFKFRPKGKVRIHQIPNRGEIDHCRWWLDVERRFIAPRLTVALGASAAYALTTDASPLRARRGKIESAYDRGPVLITWHPSYLLRLRHEAKKQARAELLSDLRKALNMLETK